MPKARFLLGLSYWKRVWLDPLAVQPIIHVQLVQPRSTLNHLNGRNVPPSPPPQVHPTGWHTLAKTWAASAALAFSIRGIKKLYTINCVYIYIKTARHWLSWHCQVISNQFVVKSRGHIECLRVEKYNPSTALSVPTAWPHHNNRPYLGLCKVWSLCLWLEDEAKNEQHHDLPQQNSDRMMDLISHVLEFWLVQPRSALRTSAQVTDIKLSTRHEQLQHSLQGNCGIALEHGSKLEIRYAHIVCWRLVALDFVP